MVRGLGDLPGWFAAVGFVLWVICVIVYALERYK